MYRALQRKLSVLLICILSLAVLGSEEAFARRGFGGGGFSRGFSRSSGGFRRSTPRPAAPRRSTPGRTAPRTAQRGIKSSRSNVKRSSGFTPSRSSSAALKRGASPARIGKNAPSRAKSVSQFKTAQRRASAKQTYTARAMKGKTVQTATPSSRINRSHKQYSSGGLYRGTTRDTYRGTTVIHNYNYGYGGMGFGGGFGGFWTGYMLANLSNALYFNWFYHNWDRMDRQALRTQMDEERYRELEQRVAELEREGVPRDPENYNVEIPDRDVQAYLEQHPKLGEEYYAATYELDRDQGVEEPLEDVSSEREPSRGSGVSRVVYFLFGMGLVWLLLRRW